jgi:uroporphyrinogen III methyltransferase/synthase
MPELGGKRILITRPRRQADEFAEALRAAGGLPVLFPVIDIGPTEDLTALDRALGKLNCYDWLVLTSVNGVQAVWERLETSGIQNLPSGLKVAAIGPKTAASLIARGVRVDFQPQEYIAEAILPGLGDLRGRWVLLPRADLARPALAIAINSTGGVAHEIAAYRTIPAKPDPEGWQALAEGVDVLTFTSSSTVTNFVALVQRSGLDPLHLPGAPLVACIGPITAATAQAAGFHVSVVAATYTTQGLLEAIRAI